MICCGLRRKSWLIVLIGAGVTLGGGELRVAAAAETEARIFNVKVDGKPAGTCTMKISGPNDQASVECWADISASVLLVRYKYTYRGTEKWENGRLVRLKSETNDDGKQYDVLAEVAGDKLRVRVNGAESKIGLDAWTTTYWRAPSASNPNRAVLLDCDNGKEIRGKITLVAQMPGSTHYRIREGVKVDVWYDDQQRLIQQDSIDSGHRIQLELVQKESR